VHITYPILKSEVKLKLVSNLNSHLMMCEADLTIRENNMAPIEASI